MFNGIFLLKYTEYFMGFIKLFLFYFKAFANQYYEEMNGIRSEIK